MKWLTEAFIVPTGSVCKGLIDSQGESLRDDRWGIKAVDNRVDAVRGCVVYAAPRGKEATDIHDEH